jgi:hypothetical protein
VIISIILIVIVIVGLVVYFDYSSIRNKSPAGTPPLLYSNNFPQPINASQGTTQQVNLTLTSYQSPEIAIPIENIMIAGYTSAIYYGFNGTSPWSTSAQETVFNYSFSLSQLILQPNMSNSTIITINLANNAPLGSYSLDIHLGKIIFLSPPGKYDVSYSEGIPLVMVVTPNETS